MALELSPERDQFVALARKHRVVPVWTELLADLITPVAIFARLVPEEATGFLLESVEHGERWSRWSFVGRNPLATLTARGNDVTVTGHLPVDVPTSNGMLAAVETLVAELDSPNLPDLPPLHGGLLGYLGYDVVREVEHLPNTPPDHQGYPDAIMHVVGELAAIDHWRQRVTLISNVIVPEDATDEWILSAYDLAAERLADLAAAGATPLDEPMVQPPRPDDPLPTVKSSMGLDLYSAAVEAAREHILAGDIFQVVLAQRFDFDLDADPFDMYRVLRQVNPSPYMYLVRNDEVTLIGSSPEPMVQLLDNRVISRPIAGTRRRGATDEEDRRLGAELAEHPKETAEHIMLVDLARNDVGRVVRFGTEQVDELMILEHYSHVMHLTSQVSGELAPGNTPIDVLRATLPAGTVSGAPKVRAMEIIDDLEPTKRGPYAGVVGYIDFSGNIDTAIAIRTMVVSDGKASVQAGAGIVIDSVGAEEHAECVNKAKGLLAGVAAARRMTQIRRQFQADKASRDPREANDHV